MVNYSLTDDDDDDDDDVSPSQAAQQPAQQAVQQATQQVTADAEVSAVDEAIVADNIDDINANNEIQSDSVDTGAKDPQQAAQDQAATINNAIDPVGNEAIVDDEDGKNKQQSKRELLKCA